MTAEELTAELAFLGMSPKALAAWLEVTPASVWNWRAGKVAVPRYAEVALALRRSNQHLQRQLGYL